MYSVKGQTPATFKKSKPNPKFTHKAFKFRFRISLWAKTDSESATELECQQIGYISMKTKETDEDSNK